MKKGGDLIKNIIATIIGIIVCVIFIVAIIPVIDMPSDDETLDILIIDGQSNAEYYISINGMVDVPTVNAELGKPHHRILYYGTDSTVAEYNGFTDWSDYSIHDAYVDGSYVVGGLVAPLGYYYSEKSGHDVLIINAGVGGKKISLLLPGTVGGDWRQDLIDHIMPEITGYSKLNKIGWIWLQGESDKTTPISSYKDSFHELQRYYENMGYDDCYIVKTRYLVGQNATIAQNQLIIESENVHMGTEITDTFTGTSYMADSLHYSQAARILICEDLSEVIPASGSSSLPSLVNMIPVLLIAGLIVAVSVSIFRSRYYQ